MFEKNVRYLPAECQERIIDLMKEKHITQEQLAEKIGISGSTLSRFLNGKKSNLTYDQVSAIADYFHVSMEFILGKTVIPDRMNHEISELGLSAGSVKALLEKRFDTKTLNMLLEHPRFPELILLVSIYAREIGLAGIQGRNQYYDFADTVMRSHVPTDEKEAEAVRSVSTVINSFKQPEISTELLQAQSLFGEILQDIRKNSVSYAAAQKPATIKFYSDFYEELEKRGIVGDIRKGNPESIADASVATAERNVPFPIPESVKSKLRTTFAFVFRYFVRRKDKVEEKEAC